jgi:hypothetical protein
MELHLALIIYFASLLTLTIIFYKLAERNIFPSFILSLVISMIILVSIYPPSEEGLNNINSATSIYYLVLFGSFVIFFIYVLIVSVSDYKRSNEYFEV